MTSKTFHRKSLFILIATALSALAATVACGIDTPVPAAKPNTINSSLTTPTVFAVIEVTPVPDELVAQFEGGGSFKHIPPALDTRFVIVEPRVEVIQSAWRQYLAGALVTSEDGAVEWTLCIDGTGTFEDEKRSGDPGRWLILNPPRSLDWHEAVIGTYSLDGKTILAVLSMFDGVPHMSLTDWEEAPRRGRPKSEPVPLSITVLKGTACQSGS